MAHTRRAAIHPIQLLQPFALDINVDINMADIADGGVPVAPEKTPKHKRASLNAPFASGVRGREVVASGDVGDIHEYVGVAAG